MVQCVFSQWTSGIFRLLFPADLTGHVDRFLWKALQTPGFWLDPGSPKIIPRTKHVSAFVRLGAQWRPVPWKSPAEVCPTKSEHWKAPFQPAGKQDWLQWTAKTEGKGWFYIRIVAVVNTVLVTRGGSLQEGVVLNISRPGYLITVRALARVAQLTESNQRGQAVSCWSTWSNKTSRGFSAAVKYWSVWHKLEWHCMMQAQLLCLKSSSSEWSLLSWVHNCICVFAFHSCTDN